MIKFNVGDLIRAITKEEDNICGGSYTTYDSFFDYHADLKKLKEKCNLKIYTDSSYVLNAFSLNWIKNWQSNNWKTANKKEVQNKELWLKLIELTALHNIEWVKVKGHSDNKYNNVCDKLARDEITKNTKKIVK